MFLSSKSTEYLIDGCNFSMAVFKDLFGSSEEAEREMMLWLSFLAQKNPSLSFRVFFDGPFRAFKPALRVLTVFCEGEKADERIEEQSEYCSQKNERIIVVTDDRNLSEAVKKRKIKVMSCRKFFSFGKKIE